MTVLYEVPRNTKINVEHLAWSNQKTNEPIKELLFHHMDGIVGICTDEYDNTIYINATIMVKIVNPSNN